MNPTSLALAIGGSVALVTAIVGLILANGRHHDCGCAGASLCHGDTRDSDLPRRVAIRVNVDELRDHLLRILDLPAVLDRIHGRLNRHRRDIDQQRRDHGQLRHDHEELGAAHDELNDRVNDHLSQPHDTAAITDMIAEERRRSEEAMADLQLQITEMRSERLNHHHRFHAPNWILSALLGVAAFAVMYLLDLTVISHAFVNHFAIVAKHETYGMINFDWSWAKLGLAFAVGMSIFTAAAVVTSMFHTERTGPAIGVNDQQAP